MSPEVAGEVHAEAVQALSAGEHRIKQHKGEANAYHSYGEDKVHAFAGYINSLLQGDPDLADVMPVDTHSDALFGAVGNGILLCKLINMTQPGIIFERAINLKIKGIHHKVENQNLAINSAKAIGCNVVNIGAADLIEGKEHLVLGLVWQIIKIMLLKKVSLRELPELAVLLNDGEALSDLLKLSPELILLRWVNHHLKRVGSDLVVSNFGEHFKDSKAYVLLMSSICPEHCDTSPLSEADPRKRALRVISNAGKMGCKHFVTADHIVNGNAQLNLAFTALLFNEYPALELPVESEVRQEMAELLDDDDVESSREERVFRNWINSLGLSEDVNSLYEDCKTGEPLLEIMEHLVPDSVNWKMVKRGTKIQIKKVQNCNYVVDVAQSIGVKVVNLGGSDIEKGNKKLILGLVWQLMRYDTIALLEKLGGGKKVSDQDLIKWSNDKVAGKGRMSSFQDDELSSSRFLLSLCDAVTPGVVNWDVVTPGETAEGKEQNAKYALSVARKMGCGVFLLWEDVVEVKPKMLMTFVGSLMALDASK